jgi:rubrerythrin
MNVEAVFRPLSDLEKSLADLYAQWAAVFDTDREAAFLFVKMANEEKGHASLVDYQRRVIQKNPKLSGDVEADLGVIESALEEIRALRESPNPPTLAEAVKIALQLESSAAESHYKNALRNANVELERLLNCLGGEDRGHLERLKAFARSRGIVPGESAGS